MEPQITDYYNEIPNGVNVIDKMNKELDDVREEHKEEIKKLKKLKKIYSSIIEDVFQYFRDEPDNEIMKNIFKLDTYNSQFVFKCSGCECIADERDILYEDLPDYLSYFSDSNTENKLCYECFNNGYTEFFNEIIYEHFNIECIHTVYTNEHTGNSDLGILLILLHIANSESKDKYNDLIKLLENYEELTYDWDGPPGIRYPSNQKEEMEEDNFIINFKKILKEICGNSALISNSRNSNYYRFLRSILSEADLDPNVSNDIIFNELIRCWKCWTR